MATLIDQSRAAEPERVAGVSSRGFLRDLASDFWKYVVLLVLAVLTFYPIFFMVETSFKDTPQFYHSFWWFAWPLHLENYSTAWGAVSHYVVNSLLVCITSLAGVLLFSSLSGYVFARYRFFGREVLFYAVIAILMVPNVLTLVPTFLLVRNLGLLNTYWAMILPYIAGGQVFAIFLLRGFIASLPEEVFESARVDGASAFQSYLYIAIPLSLPILSVIAVTNFLGNWNEFLWPLVTINDDAIKPITTGLLQLSSQYGSQTGALFASYVIASLPLFILFMFASRTFVKGITSGAFKM